jgi:hypothetical protein
MWLEVAFILVAAFYILYIQKGAKKTEEYIKSELEDIKEKLKKCISGIAINLTELDDGEYEFVKEIIHPRKSEKIIAILADPYEEGDDMIFIKVQPGTVVPKKFIVRDGEIFFDT